MTVEIKKKKSSILGKALRFGLFGGRAVEELSIAQEEQMQSPMRTMMRNFREKPTSMLGMWIFIIVLLCSFVIPIFAPLDTGFQDPSQQNIRPGFSMMAVPAALRNNALQIDGGAYFGAGIDKDGNLYMWGNLTDKLKAVPAGLGKVKQVSCGLDHIIVQTEDGRIVSWGYDRLKVCDVPRDVENANIQQIFAGYQYSAAVDDAGNIYTWGNENVISATLRNVRENTKKVVLNPNTGFVLTLDNRVECLATIDLEARNIPEEIQGRVVDIATTDNSAAAILDDNTVVVWGNPTYGVKEIPEEVQGHAVEIEGGRGHYTARLDDGTVRSWGWDLYGQAEYPKNAANIVSISSDYYQNYAIDANGKVYTWGLKGYLMGSDQYGRDVATRLATGGRVTLTIGMVSVIIAGIIGLLLGGVSGYFGGKVDMLVMRLGEVINAIPFIPLALVLSALLAGKMSTTGRMMMMMVILGILSWPGIARLVRGQILAEREKEFVTAAKALGVTEVKIIFKHIMPNVITVALVSLTLSFASSMLQESSLSYLGFGITEPDATWGNMLYACNSSTVMQNYWWRWAFPAIALSVTTIGINMAGDGLRDAIDPKSNDR